MHSPMLIGLAGYAGAGKDTAAKGLIADGWERRSFADKLRDFLYGQNPDLVLARRFQWLRGRRIVPLVDLVDEKGWDRAKNQHPEVRALLQRTGTEGGRAVLGENVWVDAALADLPDRVVVTDVRFRNEVDAVRDRWGLVVWIKRPGVEPVNGHVSDNSLSETDCDAVLLNDGDPAQLADALCSLAMSR